MLGTRVFILNLQVTKFKNREQIAMTMELILKENVFI